MDDAATALRKQRQFQIEEKRKRLEGLRQRRKDKQRSQYSFQPSSNAPSSVIKHAEEQGDLDAVIQDLLGKDHQTNEGEQIYITTGEETQEISQTPLQPDAPLRTVELSKSGLIGLVNESHVKPECYDKECQTEHQNGDCFSSDEEYDGDREELQGGVDDNQSRRLSAGSSLARRCLADSANVVTTSSFEPQESGLGNTSNNTTNCVKELSGGDKNTILCSEEFKLFLGDTARVIERALNERSVFDILLDYREINDNKDEESAPSRSGGKKIEDGFIVAGIQQSANRSATDMHWSPHHAEHFLASYGAPGGGLGGRGSGDLSSALSFRRGKDGNSDDPDGVVLVWSLASEECPELIFHAQSPVLAAKFHTFDQHLIAGGTYLGEVLLWDTRAKSLPAQRTRLVAGGHTYPVYSLEIVGTSSTHTIVTGSTDGKVAWWDPRQLDTPMESMLVVAPSDEFSKCRLNAQQHQTMSPATTSPVAITCMDYGGGTGAYTDNDAEMMVLGSESGDLYMLPTRARHCKDIQHLPGHFGMVTSVDFHPSSSSSSSSLLSGLMVSSSVDWTTQLWHKSHSGRGGTRALATLSSGRYDYVCSAQWSPGRPALLATGNSSGDIDMWDLLHSMDEPLVSVTQESLTKLAWSKDGRCIVTGDNVGALHIYAVPQEVVMPRPDEESKLDHLLWGLVAPQNTGEKL